MIRKSVPIVQAITLLPTHLFAMDGVLLINDSTVAAAGGYPSVISGPGSYKLSGNLPAKGEDTDVIRINTGGPWAVLCAGPSVAPEPSTARLLGRRCSRSRE